MANIFYNLLKTIDPYLEKVRQQKGRLVNLTQYTQGIKNPALRLGVSLPLGIIEDLINTPSLASYSATKLVTGKIPQEKLSAAAGLGESLLNVYTLGSSSALKQAGKQLIKEVGEQVGKKTVKDILKQGVKRLPEAMKVGAKYGGLYSGLRSVNLADEELPVSEQLKQGAIGVAQGISTGALLGGLASQIPTVTQLSKLGLEKYKKMPNREAGFVDVDELLKRKKTREEKAAEISAEQKIPKVGDIIGQNKEKAIQDFINRFKQYNIKQPEIKKGLHYPPELLKIELKNPNDRKIADRVYNWLSRAGEKSFQGEKSQKAIPYYIRMLGGKEVEASMNKAGTNIKNFWADLKAKAEKKGLPNWEKVWKEANETLIKQASEQPTTPSISKEFNKNKPIELTSKVPAITFEEWLNKKGININEENNLAEFLGGIFTETTSKGKGKVKSSAEKLSEIKKLVNEYKNEIKTGKIPLIQKSKILESGSPQYEAAYRANLKRELAKNNIFVDQNISTNELEKIYSDFLSKSKNIQKSNIKINPQETTTVKFKPSKKLLERIEAGEENYASPNGLEKLTKNEALRGYNLLNKAYKEWKLNPETENVPDYVKKFFEKEKSITNPELKNFLSFDAALNMLYFDYAKSGKSNKLINTMIDLANYKDPYEEMDLAMKELDKAYYKWKKNPNSVPKFVREYFETDTSNWHPEEAAFYSENTALEYLNYLRTSKTPEQKIKDLNKEFQPKTSKKTVEQIIKEPTMLSFEQRLEQLKKLPKSEDIIDANHASEVTQNAQQIAHRLIDDLNLDIKLRNISYEDFINNIAQKKSINEVAPEYERLYKKYRNLMETLYEISGAKESGDVGRIEGYFPEEAIMNEVDRARTEVFKNFVTDAINIQLGHFKQRKGLLTEYNIDVPTVLKNYADQAIIRRFDVWKVAQETGRPVEAIKLEKQLGYELGKAAAKGESFDKIDSISQLKKIAEVEAIAQGKPPPTPKRVIRIQDAEPKHLIERFQVNFRLASAEDKLKWMGVYKESGVQQFHQAGALAFYDIENVIKPKLEISDFDGIAKYIKDKFGFSNPENYINQLKNEWLKGNTDYVLNELKYTLKQAYQKDALNTLKKFIQETDIRYNPLEKELNYLYNRLTAETAYRQGIFEKSLGIIRAMYSRGVLGLNIRSAIQNLIEIIRGFAAGNMRDFPKVMFEFAKNPKKFTESYLNKYGVDETLLDEYLAKKYGKDAKTLLEKVDKVLFAFFRGSEAAKDAILLRTLELDGIRKGKSGQKLIEYVRNRFETLAIKYGIFGEIEAFRNPIVRTLFQFGQYGIKDFFIHARALEKAINAKTKEGRLENLNFLVKSIGGKMVALTLFGKIFGFTPNTIATIFSGPGLQIDTSDKGEGIKLNVNLSPAFSLLSDGADAIGEIYKAYVNNEDIEFNQVFTPRLQRNLALLVPGGNQLINKTGRSILDMLRGYNASATGLVRYPSPQSFEDKAKALLFGPYYTSEAFEYFKTPTTLGELLKPEDKEQPLKGTDDEYFKFLASKNKDEARQYYYKVMNDRDRKKEEDKLLNQFEKHGLINTESKNQLQQSGTDLFIFHPQKGIVPGPDLLTSMIEKNLKDRDVNSMISKVMKIEGRSKEEKLAFLKQQGITDEQIKNWYKSQLKALDTKETADWIMQQDPSRIDFGQLYMDGVFTFDVAKELERRGYIKDAKSFYNNVKLVDPYELRQLKIKLEKERLQNLKKYLNKSFTLQRQQIRSVKSLLKKSPKVKIPKVTLPKVKKVAIKSSLPKISLSGIPKLKQPTKSVKAILAKIKSQSYKLPKI
jgi:hypothetical protein